MSNRDDLLEAAVSCIKEKGYAQTTARDLVERSGTNLGAIGYHFGSKEKLLNEAVYLGFAEWLDAIAALPPPRPDADLWADLERAIEALLSGFEERRALCVAFVEALAQAERSEELRAQVAAGYERYREAVAARLRAAAAATGGDGLPESDAGPLAAAIVALSDGLLIQWLVDPGGLPDAAELVGSLRRAFASDAGFRSP